MMNTSRKAAQTPDRRRLLSGLAAIYISVAAIAIGCGGGGSTSSTTTTSSSTGTSQYVAAYKAADWGPTVTLSYPSSCEMTITTTGKPNYTPNAYYLAPATGSQTVVAHTAVTNTALGLISYAGVIEPSLQGSSATVNICPAKAATATATSGGAIGYLISGTTMFDPFEMDASTPAVADNASYIFTDSSGAAQTAYFLDQCDSHSNGTTWHAHGNPDCVISQVDTGSGASHIIGVALDGFPIYGGRDINGNIISVSQLDSCNGITSVTPEFPIGVTTKNASLNCYSGTVSQSALASAKKLACNMKAMFAMIESKQENKRATGEMVMPDGSTMAGGSELNPTSRTIFAAK